MSDSRILNKDDSKETSHSLASDAISPDLSRAIVHFQEGRTDAARDLCQAMLEQGRFALSDACVLSVLLRKLEQTEDADGVWQTVKDTLDQSFSGDAGSVTQLLEAAKLLAELEALDEAEALCRYAHSLAPDDEKNAQPVAGDPHAS